MPEHSGSTASIWMKTETLPAFRPLEQNTAAEVCIVGGGIAGLSTGYFLTQAGISVVILDDGPICSGETERTTAHLSFALDDRYCELERMHGEKGARLAAESHRTAVDLIEQITLEHEIQCDFERLDGYLFTGPGQSPDLLHKELKAAHRAGLKGVTMMPQAPLPSYDTGPCLRFSRQGQFHPLKYLAGLAQFITARGGRIYTHTRASEFHGGADAFVQTDKGFKVATKAIVVATNTPVHERVVIHTKQAPYRSYVIGARIPKDSIPRALYWDTEEPYHYVRLQTVKIPGPNGVSVHDLLIVGGEDHKTGQADDAELRYSRLELWARDRFPMIQSIDFQWSGQIMEPVDGLAFIGRSNRDEENVYCITGDSGHGMTHGTIGGKLVSDLIRGIENEWATLYDPSRKSFRASGTFARENLNVAARYAEWATPGEVSQEIDIPAGSGAVIRRGLHKIAVFRDADGTLHELSATCPHLGCVVHWNHSEGSWDCPCHGSRFDCHGKVVNGPALSDLTPVSDPVSTSK